MSRPRAPGWYPDPADPALLRHWNGEGWDERRRHLPGWVIASEELEVADPASPPAATPEGPYRGRWLPALTAPAAGGASRRRRLVPPPGVWHPPLPPTSRTGTAPRHDGGDRRRGGAKRRRGVALMVVAALFLLSVSGTVAGSLTPSANPLAPDTAFLREANTACVTSLGGVRPVASSASGASSPAAVQAARVDLAGLSRRIRRLAVTPGAAPVVDNWLHLWVVWGSARLTAAEAAAGAGRTGSGSGSAASTSSADAAGSHARAALAEADAFAVRHGLADCTLGHQQTSAILPVP